MKKIILLSACLVSLSVVLLVACNKDPESRTDHIKPLTPADPDMDAGTWKPVLLVTPDEFPLAAPLLTTSPDYVLQLSEIKSLQADITPEEKRIVEYWSAGGVLRWNEILRDLVARHNLPPYQNDDGTYPFPSAANPLAYPLFPFANPPYAARAYAYVAAAQYDALVAAWHYKTLYNRAPAYTIDSNVKVLVPRSALPSYPAEDGVIEGAAVEMLKLLFPGDQEYIMAKAAEHKLARLISGANIRSELEAGEALGKSVASKFLARARGDRAGAAAGNQAGWTKLEDDCIARGETPWYSLESPKRPPMLPVYGKVKAFLFDSLTAISLRPGPPPSVHSDQMRQETEEIAALMKNPSREDIRIVHFWADGVGTYTPAGHWDAIAAEDFITKNFSEVRWARNLALVNMALMDAGIVCWDTKMFYFNPRPSQMDPSIKTITGVPNFPAYISGHSTFSAAAATVLGHIIPEKAAAYTAMANEASRSRMVGGIHFRSDCQEGLAVGTNIGNYAVQRALTDGAE